MAEAGRDGGAPPTVETAIDTAPLGRMQIGVFVLCIVASVLDGFDTQSIAFVAPAISADWAVSQLAFGFVFSATLLGSVVGSAAFGLLADRIGRRRLIIATTAMFGLFSAACALAASFEQLLLFRFLGGLGMGGLIPNMLALAAEYAPRRIRSTIVTFVLWGFPLGAVFGGMLSAPLLEHAGWRAVFWLGAVAPLLLALAMIPLMPESLRYLSLDPRRRDEVVRLLGRIAPDQADEVVIERPRAEAGKPGLAQIFAAGLALPTLILAISLFLSLFLTYALINWTPTLLTKSGLSVSDGIFGAVALNLGGIVGSYFFSQGLDRVARPPLLLAAGYGAAAAAIALTSLGGGSPAIALSLLLLCGLFQIGAQLSLTAYTTATFPVRLRGTGIGFVQAVGRTGSLIGPVVGGLLLSRGVEPGALLRLSAIPALLCAIALLILGFARPRPSSRENHQ
ncbi:MFS transporter [Sphingomonas sp. C8-2]|jgi:AAHS family 4-hydroxybenzoate transporter-like MFS transporter|nr:MFS transporter [Sphingomonas sp. C8-2]